jgi:hypothetical protein
MGVIELSQAKNKCRAGPRAAEAILLNKILNHVSFENPTSAGVVSDVLKDVKTQPRIFEASSRSERRTRQVKMVCNTRSMLEVRGGRCYGGVCRVGVWDVREEHRTEILDGDRIVRQGG